MKDMLYFSFQRNEFLMLVNAINNKKIISKNMVIKLNKFSFFCSIYDGLFKSYKSHFDSINPINSFHIINHIINHEFQQLLLYTL